MSRYNDEAIETARQYYNSEDADNFYFHVWGGEDLHVGIYQDEEESIFDASRRTVQRMASKLSHLGPDSYVLDVGAGYGGSARYLAHTYGCQVVALNLSERENERGREMNKEQGIDHLVQIVDGAFEELPYGDETFDIVWSQDAILHSGDRAGVMSEIARVLKPGGELVFTDPMQVDNCPEGVLQPIYDRIHLSAMGSPGFYREELKKHGMTELEFDDQSSHLPRHYGRAHKELERREPQLDGLVSQAYIDRMKTGLQHWVEGGNNGYLTWGIFHFRKG